MHFHTIFNIRAGYIKINKKKQIHILDIFLDFVLIFTIFIRDDIYAYRA